jgi:hypothetical protein
MIYFLSPAVKQYRPFRQTLIMGTARHNLHARDEAIKLDALEHLMQLKIANKKVARLLHEADIAQNVEI